jgi:hypothetical protein
MEILTQCESLSLSHLVIVTLIIHCRLEIPSNSGRLIFDVDDDMLLSASLIAYSSQAVNLSVIGTVVLANSSGTPNTANTVSRDVWTLLISFIGLAALMALC